MSCLCGVECLNKARSISHRAEIRIKRAGKIVISLYPITIQPRYKISSWTSWCRCRSHNSRESNTQLGVDVVESWLSAVEANTSRGQAEIAASGDRINHSLELAIPESDAQPGLLIPGMIVEVQFNEPEKNYRGYVQNNAVSVPGRGLAKCRQSITIEQPIGWES